MNTDNIIATPSKQDHQLLRNTVYRLSATTYVYALAVIFVLLFFWLRIAKQILTSGKSIDFSRLDFFGEQANELLQRFNPYFWWVVVTICTLIVIWVIYLIVKSIFSRAQLKLVDQSSFNNLAEQLSPAAIEVLLWAWPANEEPLRLGDLKHARNELANGRAGRLFRAARQRSALESARQNNKN